MSKQLINARLYKHDEFYTQYSDIEKELYLYKDFFKDKVVFCNCDNPYTSEFFNYFVNNFITFGLRKIITTNYCGNCNPCNEFSLTEHPFAYKAVITAVQEYSVSSLLSLEGNTIDRLYGDGDFRSEECVTLLDEADIVVTNPPFSLWREYVKLLMEYKKKFLILGNVNAITYKSIFPYIKNNLLWLGHSIHSGDREFRVPENYPLDAAGFRVTDDGTKYIRVKGVRWFTNLDYKQRHEPLTLYKLYTPEQYPKYDNYDAIEVGRTSEIPCDYAGVIGVPITFMDKYNPDQFEILGIDRYVADNPNPGKRFDLNGKEVYARILIRNRFPETQSLSIKTRTHSTKDHNITSKKL